MTKRKLKTLIRRTIKGLGKAGATNVEVANFLRADRLDSIWYSGDTVLSFDYKETKFLMKGIGDIKLYVLESPDGKEFIEKIIDKSGGGIEPKTFTNDKELKKLISENRIVYDNSNWFELISFGKTGKGMELNHVSMDLLEVLNSEYLIAVAEESFK